jgi:hypothetical protein
MDRKEKAGPLRFAPVTARPGQAGRQFRLKFDDFMRKINKVTAAQDDDSVGVSTKNDLNKLALMLIAPARSRCCPILAHRPIHNHIQ